MASQPARHPEPYGFCVRLGSSFTVTAPSECVRSSDVDDAILPFLPYLTHQTPYTHPLLTTSIVTLILSIPFVYIIPFRLAVLFIGLVPFFFTHPFTRSSLLPAISSAIISPFWKTGSSWLHKILDDNKLEDKHWRAELRRVEVFENERWNPNSRETSGTTASPVSGSGFLGSQSPSAHENARAGGGKPYLTGWGKSNLKSGERKAWTRGRDGWSGIAEGGDVRSVSLPSLLCAAVDSRKLTTRQQLFNF